MMEDKPIVWFKNEIRTPPFSFRARQEVGRLLRDLQQGHKLNMPESRSMPIIGKRCHELRVFDSQSYSYWRIVYRIDKDAVLVVEVFSKKSARTPKHIIDTCIRRLKYYDSITNEES